MERKVPYSPSPVTETPAAITASTNGSSNNDELETLRQIQRLERVHHAIAAVEVEALPIANRLCFLLIVTIKRTMSDVIGTLT